MSRHWREKIDPKKHTNWMDTCMPGGDRATAPEDSLVDRWVYLVEVCSFKFEFVSIEQIKECHEYFRQKIHPSSSVLHDGLEHFWQRWYERLPAHLGKTNNRKRVIKALERAIAEFESET